MPNCDSSVNPEKQLLTISIVTYRPDFTELRNTLNSLAIALEKISGNRFSIVIIDNSNQDLVSPFLTKNYATLPWYVIHGQGKIGFWRGHPHAFSFLISKKIRSL